MTVILDQFIHSVCESGLMTAEEVQTLLDSLAPDEKPETGEDLAKLLFNRGRLTKFQTQAIYQGKIKGLVLGNYVVLDRIGQGGMGRVFKAEHRRMKRQVALKVLPSALTREKEAVQRFQREVEAAAKLTHPNIVTAFDADEADGVHFLVMEYVEGDDLAKTVRKRGPLAVRDSIGYILQAAKGLEYAHKAGIVHRDIKPSNLLLDASGNVKVLDMGLARLEEKVGQESTTAAALTQSGQVMGTIDYMPPEQVEDTHRADHRADIYSLGCSLFYLLTGRPAYGGDTAAAKLLAHREQPIPSLCEARPDAPEKLGAVLQKMLAKHPADRHENMTEVIAELEACEAKLQDAAENTLSLSRSPADGDDTVRREGHMLTQPGGLGVDDWLKAELPVTPTQLRTRPRRPAKLNRRWVLAGSAAGAFALLLLLAGVIFMIRTPEGTIVIQVDQPDAEISVDDGKVEITAPGDASPVTIEVDEGRHTLRVSKAGFQTETTEFTMKSGGKEMITVKLLPLELAEKPAPKKATIVRSTGDNWALEFDGKSSGVHIPTLDYDGSHPITLEALVHPYTIEMHAIVGNHGSGLSGWPPDDRGRSYWSVNLAMGQQREALYFIIANHKRTPNTTVHLSGMFDRKRLWLYVDGKSFGQVQGTSDGPTRFLRPDETVVGKVRFYPRLGFRIAHSNSGGKLVNWFHGVIDEVRISNVVRYTEDFTPQRRFEPDEHTMALYHFDEGKGNVLHDSSGNGHDGAITGAKWVKWDDQKLDQAAPADDLDRQAARWVLGNGGTVQYWDGKLVSVKTPDELPKQSFMIVHVFLDSKKEVDDAGVKHLAGLEAVSQVQLHYTSITDKALEHLAQMKKLNTVYVGGTRITDSGLAYLKGLPELRRLHVAHSSITDAALAHVAEMSELTELILSRTKVTDAGLKNLKKLPKLSVLELSQTRISDQGLEDLRGLTGLKELYLDGTNVTPAGVAKLQAALPECKIILVSEPEDSA